MARLPSNISGRQLLNDFLFDLKITQHFTYDNNFLLQSTECLDHLVYINPTNISADQMTEVS